MAASIPEHLGGRGRWIFEFEANLVYRASSRKGRTTPRSPVSKTKQTKQQQQKPKKNKTHTQRRKEREKLRLRLI